MFGEVNIPNKIVDLDAGVSFTSICDDGSKIAFGANLRDGAEIFVVNSDGSELKQVTNDTMECIFPHISGDGSKIAFLGIVDEDFNMEVFVVNSDGAGLKQLTHQMSAGIPSICDDGSKVAFSAEIDGDSEIFVVNSDASGLKQLTSNSVEDWSPVISGDGSKIVFESYIKQYQPEIFVVNSDGTDPKQLTFNSIADHTPSINDDGEKIAFASILEGGSEIFVINSDGSEVKQLTDRKLTDVWASISGDGGRIVLSFYSEEKVGIAVVNSDGSGWFRFEIDPQINSIQSPGISDAGSIIAFESGSFYYLPELLVINYDGSSTEPAPNIEETEEDNFGYFIALALGIALVALSVLILLRRKKFQPSKGALQVEATQ